SSFYPAVIKSQGRLIYGQVQEVLDGADHSLSEQVTTNLFLMKDLANILMNKRFHEGSLDLEIPETQLILDDRGIPVDVARSERLFAHRLIEELMLVANIAVARFIQKHQWPSLYRIHEEPFSDAVKNLELAVHNWGFNISLSNSHRGFAKL